MEVKGRRDEESIALYFAKQKLFDSYAREYHNKMDSLSSIFPVPNMCEAAISNQKHY